MNDYTPTTDEVRACYSYRADWQSQEDVEAFDRWLAEHDAEVYRSGREDAAKAVETALGDYVYGEDFGPPEFRIVAAARGDGDCQHDWQHLKGEKCATCRRCGAARGDGEQA